MKKSRLQLKNIMCDFCGETIEKAIKSLPGVSHCKVNMKNQQVIIEYNSDLINLERIQQALASSGYSSRLLDEKSNLIILPSSINEN